MRGWTASGPVQRLQEQRLKHLRTTAGYVPVHAQRETDGSEGSPGPPSKEFEETLELWIRTPRAKVRTRWDPAQSLLASNLYQKERIITRPGKRYSGAIITKTQGRQGPAGRLPAGRMALATPI